MDTIYEIMLRRQAPDELIVDVRVTVEDYEGNEISDDYEEGFSFTDPIDTERYRMARRELNRLVKKYSAKWHTRIIRYDEVYEDALTIVNIKKEEQKRNGNSVKQTSSSSS